MSLGGTFITQGKPRIETLTNSSTKATLNVPSLDVLLRLPVPRPGPGGGAVGWRVDSWELKGTPPQCQEIRPYQGTLNHWFPLIRPYKPGYFLGRVALGGYPEVPMIDGKKPSKTNMTIPCENSIYQHLPVGVPSLNHNKW